MVSASAPIELPPAASAATRSVRHAIAALRRGEPVALREAGAEWLLLAAEAADPQALAEWAAIADEPNLLLLAGSRAALLPGLEAREAEPVVAMPLAPPPPPNVLRALADSGLPPPDAALAPPVSPPPGAEAAIVLAKLAQLLPALLAAPPRPGAVEAAGLCRAEAAAVRAHADVQLRALRLVAEAAVPLAGAASARLATFRAPGEAFEHLAVVVGRPEAASAPLVRLHSECLTGDLLGSLRCDCGWQLRGAIGAMAAAGQGVLLYLRQEGRGIGLANKLRAYRLQDAGLDTLDANRALGWGADERDFRPAAAMLLALGLPRITLMTNNPAKLAALEACGIQVAARAPHAAEPNGTNDRYLATKAARFGHLFE